MRTASLPLSQWILGKPFFKKKPVQGTGAGFVEADDKYVWNICRHYLVHHPLPVVIAIAFRSHLLQRFTLLCKDSNKCTSDSSSCILRQHPKPKPQSAQIGPDGPQHPGNRQLYDKRGRPDAGARLYADYPNPKVATFCAALWSNFTLPLTTRSLVSTNFSPGVTLNPQRNWKTLRRATAPSPDGYAQRNALDHA